MKQFLMTLAGVFVGLSLFLVGVPLVLIAAAMNASGPATLPARAVLELDLREPLTDQAARGPLAGLGGEALSVMSVIETLRRAEGDDHVKGVLIRLPEGGMEPGAADELRLAVKHFGASGKPIYAHSQGLYPAGAITSTYMVAAAADQIWMQPGASMQVTGLATEDIFFKRLFDKYGVRPQYEQRHAYKNAVNGFLYSDYTPAHLEAQLSWMGSIYRSSLAAAGADRKTDPARLRARLEAGPYLAEDALKLKLIDRLGQVREAEEALLKAAGEDAELVAFNDYADHKRARERPGRPVIAVVEAEGPILTGRDQGGGLFDAGGSIYSDDLAMALKEAAKDKDIKAIVLRLSSPGGSDTASEQILDAIRQAKAAGKPVVVSMGSYGASGGYWVASQASAIVAQPSTLTGSIGVYGGKFALGEALGRLGVDIRQANVGSPQAAAFGLGPEFTPEQRAAFAGWMDRIYDNFITRVSVGRKLSPERVRQIAQGRVWTGAQAQELGLVDEIGGFYQAVDKAKALAGLKGEVNLRRVAPRDGPIEALENLLGVQAASARTLAAAAWVLGDPRAQSLIDRAAEARMRERGALVLAPKPGF
jgi:protease IV